MTLRRLLTEDVTVVRVAWDAVDVYGNPRPGGETRVAYRGRLEEVEHREMVADRETVTSTWRLFLPAEAVIGRLDRVEAQGRVFEVDGLPIVHRTPRGAHHIEARLGEVDGG